MGGGKGGRGGDVGGDVDYDDAQEEAIQDNKEDIMKNNGRIDSLMTCFADLDSKLSAIEVSDNVQKIEVVSFGKDLDALKDNMDLMEARINELYDIALNQNRTDDGNEGH